MTQQEMYNMIKQEERRIQKNKFKRNFTLYLGIAIVFFLIALYWYNQPLVDSIGVALVYSGLYYFSGLIIFVPLVHANEAENNYFENLKDDYKKQFDSTWF